MGTFGRSFFGEATQRLARTLGLDGEIPVELGKNITPVVVVADGTAPGNATFRGRRWGACSPAINNGSGWQLLANEPIVVDSVILSNPGTAAGYTEIRFYGVGEWAGGAPVTPVALWDTATSLNEAAPILTGAAAAGGAGTVLARVELAVGASVVIPLNGYLQPGARIYTFVEAVAAVQGITTVLGRTF